MVIIMVLTKELLQWATVANQSCPLAESVMPEMSSSNLLSPRLG